MSWQQAAVLHADEPVQAPLPQPVYNALPLAHVAVQSVPPEQTLEQLALPAEPEQVPG